MSLISVEYLLATAPKVLASSGGDAEHPLLMPAADFIRMAWRVRSWTLEGSVTLGGQPMTWSVGGFGGTSYSDEGQLQLGPQSASVTRSNDGGMAGTFGNLTVQIFGGATPTDTVAQISSLPSNYYPRLVVTGTFSTALGATASIVSAPFGQTSPFQLRFYKTASDGSPLAISVEITKSPTSVALTASLLIKPGAYWAYDPADGGGPIWNTATGAQLRNPFAL